MKITDYSQIAQRYDKNPLRHKIPRDRVIQEMLDRNPRGICLLDLACGTGNYLAAQQPYFEDAPIEWIGLDASPAMLEQARGKGLDARWIQADVSSIPLEDQSVDMIKLRFAHHHFPDKVSAFREIHRVLKPGGHLSIFNICHEYSRHSWVYAFFPETRDLDRTRFPRVADLHGLLKNQGLNPHVEVHVEWREIPYKSLIQEVENRDMSQFQLIPQESYLEGLNKLKKAALLEDTFLSDVALLTVEAEKE